MSGSRSCSGSNAQVRQGIIAGVAGPMRVGDPKTWVLGGPDYVTDMANGRSKLDFVVGTPREPTTKTFQAFAGLISSPKRIVADQAGPGLRGGRLRGTDFHRAQCPLLHALTGDLHTRLYWLGSSAAARSSEAARSSS